MLVKINRHSVYSVSEHISNKNESFIQELMITSINNTSYWMLGSNREFGFNPWQEFCIIFTSVPGIILISIVNIFGNFSFYQLVAQSMVTKCKCHGVSGACAVRTCWRSLVPFDQIGSKLKKLYDNSAVLVSTDLSSKKLRPADTTIKKRSVKRTSLVYQERSPDFCVKHPQLGIQGVKGKRTLISLIIQCLNLLHHVEAKVCIQSNI